MGTPAAGPDPKAPLREGGVAGALFGGAVTVALAWSARPWWMILGFVASGSLVAAVLWVGAAAGLVRRPGRARAAGRVTTVPSAGRPGGTRDDGPEEPFEEAG